MRPASVKSSRLRARRIRSSTRAARQAPCARTARASPRPDRCSTAAPATRGRRAARAGARARPLGGAHLVFYAVAAPRSSPAWPGSRRRCERGAWQVPDEPGRLETTARRRGASAAGAPRDAPRGRRVRRVRRVAGPRQARRARSRPSSGGRSRRRAGSPSANYLTRWLKWEFYLARLDIRGVPRQGQPLHVPQRLRLDGHARQGGEVFKSVLLFETYGVPVARTAPIVVAERLTDVIAVVVLVAIGSIGLSGGLFWAASARRPSSSSWPSSRAGACRTPSSGGREDARRLPADRTEAARGLRQPRDPRAARQPRRADHPFHRRLGVRVCLALGDLARLRTVDGRSACRRSSTRRARWPARWSPCPAGWASPRRRCSGKCRSSDTYRRP